MTNDKRIEDANRIICQNIDLFDKGEERSLIAQNLLSYSRTLVECIIYKIYLQGKTEDFDWEQLNKANEFIKRNNKYLFLREFHSFLQQSVSHYIPNDDGAERLILKYYRYYIMIRNFMNSEYGIQILENLEKIPLDEDESINQYRLLISERIENQENVGIAPKGQRLYVQKVIPFIANESVYYEITLTPAYDTTSKFDRFVCYSAMSIPSYYSIKANIVNDAIVLDDKRMPISIITDFMVSIRPCELKNFSKLFGDNISITGEHKEYKNLMNYLTISGANILDIVLSSEKEYKRIKSILFLDAKVKQLEKVLDKTREIVKKGGEGSNVIRYLLFALNNKTIKAQYCKETIHYFNGLHLNWGCIPFDTMPFASSLISHNPRLSDLLASIPLEGRKHEFLARTLQSNMTKHSAMYMKRKDLEEHFDNIDNLINTYNSKLYFKHANRKICCFGENIFIKGEYDNTRRIITIIKEYASKKVNGYSTAASSWIISQPGIDSNEKQMILKEMFSQSRVFLLYGSAGTGKTYMVNIVSQLFDSRKKLLLANTNPAVENLRRKVSAQNCTFMTIKKLLVSKSTHKTDVLIVDECSMVSNKDMLAVLNKVEFKIMLLVGDVFQIESIVFGNWFTMSRYFIPDKSWAELTEPFRTTDSKLLDLWRRVRHMDPSIVECLVRNQYSSTLDSTVFKKQSADEIVLCLNYDGLYGINNINRLLQENNPHKPVRWGLWTFKQGDPVLFNETNRFTPLLYNNLKGEIVDVSISDNGETISFSIKIEKAITELEVEGLDLELLSSTEDGKSIIFFSVNRKSEEDEDNDFTNDTDIPFQTAYAISIHKAQGLEYESVKVIITREIDELITHNIFYTAITRAKSSLKIYWSPESQEKVIASMDRIDAKYDATVFSAQTKIAMDKNVRFK